MDVIDDESAGIPLMEKRGGGVIVNICSMYSLIAPDFSIYGDNIPWNPPTYGAGELALGGAMTYTSGSLAVKEGSVRFLSDAAVANVPVTFSDGTAIVLDPAATTVNGFFGGAFTVSGSGTPKVRVSLNAASAAFDANRKYVLPICTVPASAADLTGNFKLVRSGGLTPELVKENVEIGGENYVRYSAKFSRTGLIVVVK